MALEKAMTCSLRLMDGGDEVAAARDRRGEHVGPRLELDRCYTVVVYSSMGCLQMWEMAAASCRMDCPLADNVEVRLRNLNLLSGP
jgi:hypothetical protein